jgi:A/G-specific adenine glycosylase
MERFPDLRSLAAASDEDVLRHWQGLGYYTRARNLLRGARAVVDRHGGRLPATAAELRELPGIGPYTAGAIASIAHGEPVPAVDGNALRVLARLFAVDGDTTGGVTRRSIAHLATRLVDPTRPGDWNQAVMELGARVCLPRLPRCPECPVEALCEARRLGLETELPRRPPKAAPAERHLFAFALHHAETGGWLLARRAEAGLWAGLWEFALVEAVADADPAELARSALGLDTTGIEAAAPLRHELSHRRLLVTPVIASAAGEPVVPPGYVEVLWLAAGRVAERPMSALMERLLQIVGDGEEPGRLQPGAAAEAPARQ